MPHYPVLQPDHQWALYSTIVDSFTMFDITADEVLNALAEWHRFDVADQRDHLARIAAGAPPIFKHWKCWSEAAAWSLFIHGSVPEIINDIQQRTPDMDEILALLHLFLDDERGAGNEP